MSYDSKHFTQVQSSAITVSYLKSDNENILINMLLHLLQKIRKWMPG
jgi:hypothetical protein